tara:strand:- start:79606 stop:81150 length:1545 start_codon:yes stop_codon:yes gene_type:complete
VSDAPVNEGDILADKYQVDKVLGVGGMGVVVAATHVQLGHKVALKFMLAVVAENQEAKERFLREARAAAKLKSEHIAKVSDVGTLANGAPYIVMEYLEGMDLGGFLKRRGRLPVEEAVLFVMQTCAGMAEAHTHGIVHRDLKPENLFLTKRLDGTPVVKVLDFGVSKVAEVAGEVSTTRTGIAMGSPAFMSPEQMRSAKDVDERADIWSMGAILFQLLSGALPFQSDTIAEIFAQVLTLPPADLATLEPSVSVPAGLRDIIYRCLEKDPEERMSTVVELAMALAPYGGESGQRAAASIESMYPREVSKLRVSGAFAGAELSPASNGPAARASSVDDLSGHPGYARTTLGQSVGQGAAVVTPQTAVEGKRKNRAPMFAGIGVFLAVMVGVGFSMQGDSENSSDEGASASELVPAAAPAAAPMAAENAGDQELLELSASLAEEREARLKAEAHSRDLEDAKKAEASRLAAEESERKGEAVSRKERRKKRPRAKGTPKAPTPKPKPKPESDPFGSID